MSAGNATIAIPKTPVSAESVWMIPFVPCRLTGSAEGIIRSLQERFEDLLQLHPVRRIRIGSLVCPDASAGEIDLKLPLFPVKHERVVVSLLPLVQVQPAIQPVKQSFPFGFSQFTLYKAIRGRRFEADGLFPRLFDND